MNTLFNIILNLLNAGLMVYIFMLFFSAFAPPRFAPAVRTLLSVGIIAVFTVLLLMLDNGILKTLFLIGITVCIANLFQLKPLSSVLLSLAAFAMGSLGEFVTTIFISLIFSVDTQTALKDNYYVLGIIMSKFITLIPIIAIRLKRRKNRYGTSVKKTVTLLLVPISTIVVLTFYATLTNQFPIQSDALHTASLLCYAVLTVSNIILFDLIDHIYRDAEKDKQLSMARELVHSQQEQYQQLLTHNETVLKIRHDQKNFVIGLLSELDGDRLDNVRTALRDEYELLTAPGEHGNNIVDAVVSAKREAMTKDGIALDTGYQSVQSIAVSPIDLAILLGNALDNAIEAIRRLPEGTERIIRLNVKVHNDQLLISIKNPVAEAVDVNNPVSSKRGDGNMGFGILSMKSIAAKYGGQVILNCADGIFETHILMKNHPLTTETKQ